MSRQIDKEEAVQRALGTLPSYRINLFGPQGGVLGGYNRIIYAMTPIRAIYYACLTLNASVHKRFLQSHRFSWCKCTHSTNYSGRCYVRIQLDNDNATSQSIDDLRLILDINGNIRKDLSKEILDKLECIQKGERYYNTEDEEYGV